VTYGHTLRASALYRWLIASAVAFLIILPSTGGLADEIDRAVEANHRGDLEGSIEIVSRAINSGALRRDRLITALEVRCAYYSYAGRLEEALADCNRGLALDPDYGPLLINRAILYIDMNKYGLSHADLRKALQDRRLNAYGKALAYFHRGRTWRDQNNLPRALEDFDTALKWQPSLMAARLERGTILLKQGEYDRAIADFDAVVSAYGTYARGYVGRAEALIGLNKFDEAIADLDMAAGLDNQDARIFSERGRAYFFLRRNKEALADFSRALELEPDDRLSRDLRGVTSFNLGEFAKVADDFGYRPQSYTTDWHYESLDYRTLWLYLARSRMKPAKSTEFELEQVAAWSLNKPGYGTWPEPIFSVIGKKINEEDVFAAALRDATQAAQLTCEANFYLGEIALIGKEPAHGRDLLKKAADICPAASREYVAALSELERMSP
jgi:tetratricopeptide (TPR) repeat protein